MSARHHPRRQHERDVVVTPADAGWTYAGLRVLTLDAGERRQLSTGPEEMVVLPLAGGLDAECDGTGFALDGRPDVFSAVSDALYVPRGSELVLSSTRGCRVALPSSRCERRRTVRYLPAADVPVEVRGAGRSSRQVTNFGAADVLSADRLITVEVLTPAGNWSSYPPHKHDEQREGESVLEEIYYFEVRPADGAPRADAAVAYQRVSGTPDRPQDLLVEVRSGDVVTIPYGWHGPSMAPPGYDLYYLNVMAGPGPERSWLTSDHPDHAWVRDTWREEPVDPRVPMTGAMAREATHE